MKIALICDKPSLYRVLLPSICEHYPQLDRGNFSIAYANEFVHLNRSFRFPRGVRYSAFPFVKEPEFKPVDEMLYSGWNTAEIIKLSDGDEPIKIASIKLDASGFIRHLKEADVVILAHDPCPSGDYVRLRIRQWLLEHGIDEAVINVRLDCYDYKTTLKHVSAAQYESIEIAYAKARESILKRYFDYNYLVNAIAIHGETARFALGHPIAEMISKNALQILYHLRDGRMTTDGKLNIAMERWEGTGRYNRTDLNLGKYWGMGSDASRQQIIETLVSYDLLNRTGNEISISADGRLLLNALHPDSEDPDQVFRIEKWSQLSVEEGKANIDRYIRTFFGKQKRYLAKLKKGL